VIREYFSLTDQVAIVTGAGQGIGEAVALAFAEAGADVVLVARRRSPLESVAEQVTKLGRRALVVRTGDQAGSPGSRCPRRHQ
jgi:7-alpha-hydroxysteroid dehydrogenase